MARVITPTLRRPKDSALTLSIDGRAVAVVVRMRPIAPAPIFTGYTVTRDEAPPAIILQGEAGAVSGGWWIELLSGNGAPIIGATRIVKTGDLWTAHNGFLRSQYGRHLILSCTATPRQDKPLAAQCEIELTPAPLA